METDPLYAIIPTAVECLLNEGNTLLDESVTQASTAFLKVFFLVGCKLPVALPCGFRHFSPSMSHS